MHNPSHNQHARSVSWFAVIGVLAAATHYVIAVGLEYIGLAAAWANPIGFVFAFPVSYFGHRHLSFSDQSSLHRHAMPKFFMVALLGFSFNQLLLLISLHLFLGPFWLMLGVIMVIVAVGTYFLSRFWAFKSV
jgi:putative flippase GtrA